MESEMKRWNSMWLRSGLSAAVMCAALLCAASSGRVLYAQQAKAADDKAAPTPPVAAPPKYPELQADGTAVFRLAMPSAQSAEVHLEGKKDPIPMSKGADGVWSVAVPGLTPGYYSYSFNVDARPGVTGSGTEILDPHNTFIKTSFFSNQNVFLVPGTPAMPWEPADVRHGTVHHHYYHSTIVGIESEYYVYTPPGFDPKSDKQYPVLYLLHGYSDDPSAWTFMGKANIILDNLIAAGKAKPMIVVMPWGYGDMRIINDGWAAWRERPVVVSNFRRFGEALYREVMPMVKQKYPISDRREDHAIAGLSMGGAETLLIGLNHTDDFAWIGAFSAGGVSADHFEAVFPAIRSQTGAQVQSKLKLLWIACGTEDGLYPLNQSLIAWLKSNGMAPTAISTPGMHAWGVWRGNLSAFAPLLFQGSE
jgi:enterochelin esterase-like enzyme